MIHLAVKLADDLVRLGTLDRFIAGNQDAIVRCFFVFDGESKALNDFRRYG